MNFKDMHIRETLRIDNTVTVKSIKETIEETAVQRKIPVRVSKDTIRSGGLFFGTDYDCIVCRHPSESFFNVVFAVADNILNIGTWGYSKPTEQASKAEAFNKKHLIIQKKPDVVGMQKEDLWITEVINCLLCNMRG